MSKQSQAPHLQQDVVDVGVRLLNLIKEQHTEGLAAHSLCELAALPIPNVPCRHISPRFVEAM